MLVLRTTPAERRREVRYMHAARRELHQAIAELPETAERVRRREQAALLGVAVTYAGRLPRHRIRQIARRAARMSLVQKARMEAEAWEDFEVEGLHHLEAACVGGKGAVIAPVHVGHYRLIAPWMIQQGIKAAWLTDPISARFMQQEMAGGGMRRYLEACADDHASAAGADHWQSQLVPADADGLTTLWRLKRQIDAGACAVMFPDGNSAMEGRPPDESCVTVPFMGHQIRVRAGIAALARAARVPIVPAVTLDRGRRPPLLRFEAAFGPGQGEGRRAFLLRAMIRLFAHVEAQVMDTPHRWEEWMHLHRWIHREPDRAPPRDEVPEQRLSLKAPLRLASPWLWVITLEGAPQVMELSSYNSLGHHPDLVALVEAAEAGHTLGDWLSGVQQRDQAADLLEEMIGRGFIAVGEPGSAST